METSNALRERKIDINIEMVRFTLNFVILLLERSNIYSVRESDPIYRGIYKL